METLSSWMQILTNYRPQKSKVDIHATYTQHEVENCYTNMIRKENVVAVSLIWKAFLNAILVPDNSIINKVNKASLRDPTYLNNHDSF